MENISQMSLLEIAVKLMEEKSGKVNIYSLIKEVLEAKNIEDEDSSIAAQLYIDINASGKFVYMGDDEWDLKIRQPLEEYDKDGSAFNAKSEEFDDEDEDLEDDLSEDDLDDDDFDDDEDSDKDEDDEDEDEDESYDRKSSDEDEEEYDEDEHDSYDDDFDEDKYNDLMDDYEDKYYEN